MMAAPLVLLVIVAAVGFVLVRSKGSLGADFTIRYRPGLGTTVRGQVPTSKRAGINAFFARDLRPKGPVTVQGNRGPGRSLRLRFTGPLSPAQQQQARNFLLEHLR
jgi:hypothetical protein